MDWLNANSGAILTLIGVVIGGLIAAGTGYLAQSKMFEKRRILNLNLQLREHQRNRLMNISERLNRYFGTEVHRLHILGTAYHLSNPNIISSEEYKEFSKENQEARSRIGSEIDFNIDPVLFEIYQNDWIEVGRIIINTFEPNSTSENCLEAAVAAMKLNSMFQARLNDLIDETFQPSYGE